MNSTENKLRTRTIKGTEIMLHTKGPNLYVELYHKPETFEQVSIEAIDAPGQAVGLVGRRTHNLYPISAANYWRAFHGGDEPSLDWAGIAMAESAYQDQQHEAELTLLMQSHLFKLDKKNPLPCAFTRTENHENKLCGRNAFQFFITEDIHNPGQFVILPICDTCRSKQLLEAAKTATETTLSDLDELITTDKREQIRVEYPVGVEG